MMLVTRCQNLSLKQKLKSIPKQTYIYISIAFLIIITAAFVFVELAEKVLEEEKFIFDRYVREFVDSLKTPTLDSIFSFITDLGSVSFITLSSIVLAIFLYFNYKKRKWRIFYFSIAMIGISLLTKALKLLFERERPNILEQYDGTGFSFPSGHSTGPMVFYGFIIYLLIRSRGLKPFVKWTIAAPLALLILLIGFSRIYLGVHYASDVIAGHLLGLIWLTSCVLILEYTLWKRNR